MSTRDSFKRALAALRAPGLFGSQNYAQTFLSSVNADLDALVDSGMAEFFGQCCEDEVHVWVRDHVMPAFWAHTEEFSAKAAATSEFRQWLVDAITQAASDASSSVASLHAFLQAVTNKLGLVGKSCSQPTDTFRLQASMTAPQYFPDMMAVFFHFGFKCFHDLHSGDDSASDGLKVFESTCALLRSLGVLDTSTSNSAFAFVLFGVIDRHLKRECDTEFSESKLVVCEGWLAGTLLPWIRMVCGSAANPELSVIDSPAGPLHARTPSPAHTVSNQWEPIDDGSGGMSALPPVLGHSGEGTLWAHMQLPSAAKPVQKATDPATLWCRRVQLHLYESVCRIRTDQLFDIIRDFPDSTPALEDLRACLQRTMMTKQLSSSLKDQLKSRLLHPGANTSQILDMFISTIRSLRVVDPSGVLFELVSPVVKQYLRSRKDTIRCIVTSLTEDTESELFAELVRRGNSNKEPEGLWYPDPIDMEPETAGGARVSDLISTLVNVYGSKEVFVSEYRTLLSEKLLAKQDFDTEQEVRTLELLKLRFGDSAFNSCEIMIKDMAESKRVNNILTSGAAAPAAGSLPFHTTVVSGHFWPPLTAGETCDLHPRLKTEVEQYQKRYSDVKKPRKLEWVPQQGTVEVDIEAVDGSTKSIRVSQLLASLVLRFDDKETWTLQELSTVTGLAQQLLRRKMLFWVGQGVVTESSGDGGSVTYRAVDTLSDSVDAVAAPSHADTADDISPAQAEAFRVYENYVFGMLRNFGALPLDRIHNNLKMFASVMSDTPSAELTTVDLQRFLMALVREDKLEIVEGSYKLK